MRRFLGALIAVCALISLADASVTAAEPHPRPNIDGDHKYIRHTKAEESSEYLFDLAADIGEKHNLLADQPAEAAYLKELLSAWEQQVAPTR